MFVLGNLLVAVGMVLKAILNLYFWIVIVSAVVSWFKVDPYNPVVRLLRAVTEPVFYRIRRLLPFTYIHGIDFSPVVVLIVVQFLEIALVRTLLDFAYRLR